MNQCQFLNLNGRQCSRHTRPEQFPIRYSPKLNLYLCQQHEKIIVHDHVRRFILKYINGEPNYDILSPSIYHRLVHEDDLQHIPYNLTIDRTIFNFSITSKFIRDVDGFGLIADIGYSVSGLDIAFSINSAEQITVPYPYNFDIDNIFNGLIFLDFTDHFIPEPESNQLNSYQVYTLSDSDDDDVSNERTVTNELTDTSERTVTTNIDNDGIVPITNQSNLNTVIDSNTLHNIIDNRSIFNSHNTILSQTIRPIPIYTNLPTSLPTSITQPFTNIDKLKLITITSCHICTTEQLQKGFELSCCNSDVKVCVQCIINDYIIDHLKYKNFDDITDCSMFLKPKKCYYCRRGIDYSELIHDNECKELFASTVHLKNISELRDKFQRMIIQSNEVIDTLRRNLGL